MVVKKKKIQGWNLWNDGVSQRFIHCFLACKEQTRLEFLELWQPKKISFPVAFGICFHWLLRQCYGTKKIPSADAIKFVIKQYKTKWKKHNPVPSQKQLEEIELIYGLSEQLLSEYVKRWSGDWTGKYPLGCGVTKPVEWIALEKRYQIPYTYPDGKKTFLLAVFDGLFYDKKANLWLFESKTKGRIDEEVIQDLLLYDIQLMLSMLITKEGLKQKPSGVLYNLVRRPSLYQRKDELLGKFLERVQKDIKKRHDWYFLRYEFGIDWSEVQQWKKDFLDPVMEDIRNWYEGNLPTYVNSDALYNQYGRCGLYNAIVKNDFSQCTQRRKYRKDKNGKN